MSGKVVAVLSWIIGIHLIAVALAQGAVSYVSLRERASAGETLGLSIYGLESVFSASAMIVWVAFLLAG